MAMIVEIRQAPITDEVEIFIGARRGNKIEGLLEATKDHLQDMRKLVFKGEQNAGSKI